MEPVSDTMSAPPLALPPRTEAVIREEAMTDVLNALDLLVAVAGNRIRRDQDIHDGSGWLGGLLDARAAVRHLCDAEV